MSEIVYIQNGRLSFPHIAEPQQNKTDPTKAPVYNADIILGEDNAGYQKFMAIYAQLAAEKWKDKAQGVMQMIHADRKKRCYGDGSEKINGKTFQPYDGYAGQKFISARNPVMPQIIRADGSVCDNMMEAQQLARKMYGGCRINVAIKPWLQDNTHGRGIRCDLIAIQFAGDDTPFGEASEVDVSGVFGAVSSAPQQPAAQPAAQMPGMPAFLMGGQQ